MLESDHSPPKKALFFWDTLYTGELASSMKITFEFSFYAKLSKFVAKTHNKFYTC
jgi:hypothetical protein